MPQSYLPDIIRIAEGAGDAIMAIYQQTDIATTTKADRSPLTEADLASHRHIVSQLMTLTPDIPVLSEESEHLPYAERQAWRRFWLVDPLDGTKEFIKRNGEFTVNIALIEAGKPVLGVVYAPVLKTTYSAAQGSGAYKEEAGESTTRITVTEFSEGAERSLQVVASRSHAGAETEAFLNQLRQHYPLEVISSGSSLKFCLVAEGRAQLYPRFGPTMEWDTAAAQCIVEEAGGVVHQLRTQTPLSYNKADLHNPHFMVGTRDMRTQVQAFEGLNS